MPNDELFSSPIEVRGPLQSTRSPRDREPNDVYAEKLFQWQQTRLQKRLDGEYQSQVFRLSELVGGNLSTPLSVSRVRIEGASKTRPGFLARVVNPYFNDGAVIQQQSTLETVLQKTKEITYALARTQLFKNIVPEIETPQSSLAGVNEVDLVFRCEERSRLSLKSSTEVGNGDASASANVRLRNAFGGAEDLEGSVAYGMKTQHTYRLSLSAPLTGSMLTRGELTTYAIDNDYQAWASCKEAQKGVKAAVSTINSFGQHELSYQAVMRHVHSLTPDASMSIRRSAGTSLKSSIHYNFIHDTRDDSVMGRRGMYFKLNHELAGIGGDTSFAKIETESQASRQLFKGLHVSLATRAGFLYPLGGKATMFSDRFKLGGPLNVRSFRHNSLGPRDHGDAVGGDTYWAAGLSFIGDLPKKPHWPLKPHVYINAGKLSTLDRTQPLKNALRDAVLNPSISVGIGLIYRFDPIRLEVNFGMPLVANKSDGYQRGFQIGFGLECL
ncbi:hypothetical protein FRB91_004527 [Serendipita sp. 411]|nr:hypothetical protein FRB91_004527 [Serendipita sp. 411]